MKNSIVLSVVLLLGLIFGNILGKIVEQWVPLLNVSEQITWQPKGDFGIVTYDFSVRVRLTLGSFVGLVGAYWLFKKMK